MPITLQQAVPELSQAQDNIGNWQSINQAMIAAQINNHFSVCFVWNNETTKNIIINAFKNYNINEFKNTIEFSILKYSDEIYREIIKSPEFFKINGKLFVMIYSPDGQLLRFIPCETKTQQTELIQLLRSASLPKLCKLPGEPKPSDIARLARVEGLVTLQVTLGPDGVPIEAKAISGPVQLRYLAEDYALKCKFYPMIVGIPYFSKIFFSVKYTLPPVTVVENTQSAQ